MKNAHRIARGIIEVLIFFITTNLINVPATNMAIKSFMNHASVNITMSRVKMNEHNRKATPYITVNLSEQHETISLKNRNINKNEKAITM
jgi:hypothetical protein